MTDIKVCTNNKCELKDTCYRANADDRPNLSFSYYKPINGECEHYVKMEKRNERR